MKYDYSYVALPKIYNLLEPYEWLLFTVLFDEWNMMKNEDGWFFRSEEELSNDSGLSVSTIQRRTKALEEKGIIEVRRHNDGKKTAKYDKANDYKINMDKVNELSKKVVCQTTFNEKEGGLSDIPTKEKNINNNLLQAIGYTVQAKPEQEGVLTKKEESMKQEQKDSILNENEIGTVTDLPKTEGIDYEVYLEQDLRSRGITPPTPEKPEKAIKDYWADIQVIKDSMFLAKSQSEYDKALEDLRQHLKVVQSNTSPEAYQEYRGKLAKWYRATVQYLKFDERNRKPEQDEAKKPAQMTLEDFITFGLKELQEDEDFSLDSGFEKYLTEDGLVDCPKIEAKINEAFEGMLHTDSKICYKDHLKNLHKYVEGLTAFMTQEDGDAFVQWMNNRRDGVDRYRKEKNITFKAKAYENEE